ncbi:MAG: hypothetical protein HUJ63_10510, partial [Enterococcus sp.]|nr:hypothetical protein [Enterococcus sp.]
MEVTLRMTHSAHARMRKLLGDKKDPVNYAVLGKFVAGLFATGGARDSRTVDVSIRTSKTDARSVGCTRLGPGHEVAVYAVSIPDGGKIVLERT